MKATVYTIITLVVACSIAWFVYDGRRNNFVPAAPSFADDDQYLYNLMRGDLKAFLKSQGKTYDGWIDDAVRAAYNGGSISKSAAFVSVVKVHFTVKYDYYNSLLKNLNKKYQAQ